MYLPCFVLPGEPLQIGSNQFEVSAEVLSSSQVVSSTGVMHSESLRSSKDADASLHSSTIAIALNSCSRWLPRRERHARLSYFAGVARTLAVAPLHSQPSAVLSSDKNP